METAYDSSSAAMENCRRRCTGGEAARVVAQRLVNCGDDDGADGEAAEDSSTSSAKEDTCSAAIAIVISRN